MVSAFFCVHSSLAKLSADRIPYIHPKPDYIPKTGNGDLKSDSSVFRTQFCPGRVVSKARRNMASLDDVDIVAVKLACLCRQVQARADIPRCCFPLRASVCHCNTCRHTSGLLCTTVCELPVIPSALKVEGKTSSYKLDSTQSLVFCPGCGSSLYQMGSDVSKINIYTGVLKIGSGQVDFKDQCCMEETIDGGLASWLDLHHDDYSGKCLLHKKTAVADRSSVNEELKQSLDVTASCHCGGVQFIISPPSEASTQLSSPCSDLIVPFNSGPSKNEEDSKWWLRANGTRYFAGTCACRSCRLASGNDIQTWAFIPKINMRQMNGDPLEFDMGTLNEYGSSKGVYRNFCSICGATVFWHNDERPYLIDVSTGLLEAESGARAEELLEWTTARVSFQEEAQNKALIQTLREGLAKQAQEDL